MPRAVGSFNEGPRKSPAPQFSASPLAPLSPGGAFAVGPSSKRAELAPPPNVLEPTGRQRGIARGRVDRAMAEVSLQRPGIDALVGQRIAAGVAQHVRVDLESDLGLLAGTGQELSEPRRRIRPATLRGEDEGRR
jgi:hypothetical protein